MTKKYSTKKALVASILSLMLCFTMLLGTTFAWFTDSVTSAGNIIQSGELDVAMNWAEGQNDPTAASTAWTDASKGAIFNYDNWEPGYVMARHIRITNEGSLALKYIVKIVANGDVSDLANVIDVYYLDPAEQIDRADLTEDNKLGTLTQVLANLADTAYG
jgi:predicted ribosomally synthesized peptide with SipW-like signal peptide